ncbi:hypothetical protein BCON_0415g00010 [Botryotinia convoluta]|uniref:Uncharacterized protein n=1 Tax=Botryotinia convoluta TaxID=54673 RepID=A0A4Z1H7V9_9HELO|nr:hypothetical protein BCON_0415g00010 [Botryotinia convoluta]
MYSKTIELQTMNTRLLAAIDEDGLPLILHGPERQELQSLQRYTFVVFKMVIVVCAIVLVAIDVVVIAGVIYFGSGLIKFIGTLS